MAAQRTIQQTVASLEASTPGQKWEAIDGVQALTTVDRQSAATVSFNIGSGLMVKGFINTSTGEIRWFPAKLFGYPEENL